MTTTRLLPLALLLAGCIEPETGIDETVLSGTVQVVPGQPTSESDYVDDSSADGGADGLESPVDLGKLSYRWERFLGEARPSETATTPGGEVDVLDSDCLTFQPAADGPWQTWFQYDADGTTILDGSDKRSFLLTFYDLDQVDGDTGEPLVLVQLSTQGAPAGTVDMGGDDPREVLVYDGDVLGGGSYALCIEPEKPSDEAWSYAVDLSGSPPDQAGILVGAWKPFDDFLDRGNPVGGSSTWNWTSTVGDDGHTLTWTAEYQMMYLRSVEITNERPDGSYDVAVTEGVDEVMIAAADWSVLNEGLPAGTLYSSKPVLVQVGGLQESEAEGPDAGLGVVPIHVATPVVVDSIAPLVVGWSVEEQEPNDVAIIETANGYDLDPKGLGNAQELPTASGVGYVDIIEGVSSYTIEYPAWGDDNDTYALTADTAVGAIIKLDFDPSLDLDLHINGPDGVWMAYSWYDVPESINTSEWGIVFNPGETWYITVLPWDGPVGEYPYTITIEYIEP